MIKPNDYDNTKVGGEYTPVEAGGHICRIIKAEERMTKTNKPMIVIAFDFAKGDIQANYFHDAFEKDIRPDKKWPHAGMAYIVTVDDEGKCSKGFKSFITSLERSNGYTLTDDDWGDRFCSVLQGKIIGAVYGPVENEYNGKVTTKNEQRWWCDVAKISEQKVPELLTLEKQKGTKPAATPVHESPVEGFTPVADMDIPF